MVDELGNLPISRTGAMLFSQLISRRYEHASTVLTSNKDFEDWGEVFGDDVMASALIDRLVHRCHIVNIRGSSFRMRRHADLQQLLSPQPRPAERPTPRRGSRRQEALTPWAWPPRRSVHFSPLHSRKGATSPDVDTILPPV